MEEKNTKSNKLGGKWVQNQASGGKKQRTMETPLENGLWYQLEAQQMYWFSENFGAFFLARILVGKMLDESLNP